MTTQEMARTTHSEGMKGMLPVRPGGLLAGVRRPCPDHGADCECVARTHAGQLVFWCAEGAHHVTAAS